MYKKNHIHFVGIGGIGMSGIAKILKTQGYQISGCDLDVEQKSTQELMEIGCQVYQGNNTKQCDDSTIDVLVYSSCVIAEHPEIKRALARSIPVIPRALMLAELMRTKFSIAITGAHGKTTTTSMISHILIENKMDPTVIVGGHLKNISTNARLGTGDFLVAEADESDRSFLRLYPTLAVVTNIDLEHLDTYKDLEDIKSSFKQFLNNIPFYGKAIVCTDDVNIRDILPITHVKTLKYGFDPKISDLYATDISLETNYSTFKVFLHGKFLGEMLVPMPGRHNVLNSLAAITVALDLGLSFDQISTAFKTFSGIDRRFSFKGTYKGAEFFDDYGHHPTEIYNTLLVARKRAQKKLIVVFQPHRYSRTEKLWQDFINVFAQGKIDKLIITDIFPASEAPIDNITSDNLVKDLKSKYPNCHASYIPLDKNMQNIIDQLNPELDNQDLVLLLGAGKINKLADLTCCKLSVEE